MKRMHVVMKLILSLLFLLNMSIGYANTQPTDHLGQGDVKQVKINVELFLSSTCSDCNKADVFFRELEVKEPWLMVHRYFINQDQSSLKLFYERLQQQNTTSFAVPAIFFCDSRWVGFAGDDTSGKALLNGLTYCRNRVNSEDKLSSSTISVLQQWGNATQFRINSQSIKSPLLQIPLAALVDAFASCSLFCFIALLAFLWLYPTQKWSQLRVGLCFLLSVGFVHYLQQTESAVYYELLPKLRVALGVAGALLLLFVVREYQKLRLLVVSKPDLFGFAVIFFSVVAIYACQQTCLLNMALVFEQWLTEQTISPSRHFFYQCYYLCFYLLPMALILLFYFYAGHHERLSRFRRMLQVASCLILMTMGLLLMVYPILFANLLVSSVILFTSVLLGWIFVRRGF